MMAGFAARIPGLASGAAQGVFFPQWDADRGLVNCHVVPCRDGPATGRPAGLRRAR